MFYSILFPEEKQYEEPRQANAPVFFKDLNLDQVFTPILKEKKEYELEGFFYTALHEKSVILYRQEVMKELEDEKLCRLFMNFSSKIYSLGKNMDLVQKALTSESSYDNNYLTRGRMLDYACQYCNTIENLAAGLEKSYLHSEGLGFFARYLNDYRRKLDYTSLSNTVSQLRKKFDALEYCMMIKGGTVRVRRYEGQPDHSRQIIDTFEKFRQGEVKDYRQKISEEPYATHVEAAVLRLLSQIYKDVFEDLSRFCQDFLEFIDPVLFQFSREIQFYLSWFEYISPLKRAGLIFHYPLLCEEADHLYCTSGFDIALAARERENTVMNDFDLQSPERIIVVTGPNQGGKTTFARSFGQMHYLASLGLNVPGRNSALFLFDDIFTHFSREEDLSTQNGKLQDDLVRLHELLLHATEKSLIIMNEIFSSTTLKDALALGNSMMQALTQLQAPAVIVTFLDELASFGPEVVSMMSMVNQDDPAERTFKVVRKPPDGLAYALFIAGKHGLTYQQLNRRLSR